MQTKNTENSFVSLDIRVSFVITHFLGFHSVRFKSGSEVVVRRHMPEHIGPAS